MNVLSLSDRSFVEETHASTCDQEDFHQALLSTFVYKNLMYVRAFQVVLVAKNPPAGAGDVRDVGSIPGSGRSTGGGHGNPLLYSCPENAMDRGAWWAAVHRVAKSQTRLKRLSTAHMYVKYIYT